MNPNSRLRHETGAELTAEQTVAATQQAARDFATPEELLRFDQQQIPAARRARRPPRSFAGGPACARGPAVVEAHG